MQNSPVQTPSNRPSIDGVLNPSPSVFLYVVLILVVGLVVLVTSSGNAGQSPNLRSEIVVTGSPTAAATQAATAAPTAVATQAATPAR